MASPGQCAGAGTLSRPRRWLFAALGGIATALAVVGAILPGVPTTIFLIVASYCFARSCPWIEERLLRSRLFAPYAPYVRQGASMPRRARIAAMLLMWVSVSASLAWLAYAGWLTWPAAAAMVASAIAGSVAILSVGRATRG
jgi:uncharacterized protein